MAVGDRVKPSGYAVRPRWDWYLGLGDYTRKNEARRAYDAELAKRGTVVEALPNGGLAVRWDNGPTSRCLAYRVERA